MKLARTVVILFLGPIFCGACSAAPQVTYTESKTPDPKGKLKFMLAQSLIKIDYKSKSNPQTGSQQIEAVTATAIPTESAADKKEGSTYQIVPDDTWGV